MYNNSIVNLLNNAEIINIDMNTELEVYEYFEKALNNIETKKILSSLFIWFNQNITDNDKKILTNNNFLLELYKNGNSELLIPNQISKLKIFASEHYYELFINLKKMTLNKIEPINQEFINNFQFYNYLTKTNNKIEVESNNKLIKVFFKYSLNELLKTIYDLFIDYKKKYDNFLIDEKYNKLINTYIKDYIDINYEKIFKNNSNYSNVYLNYNKKFYLNNKNFYYNNNLNEKNNYMKKLFENNKNNYYYKIFNFSFDTIDINNYKCYIDLFMIILNYYNQLIIENIANENKEIEIKKITDVKIKKNNNFESDKKKKKQIPPLLKIKVWNKYIGDEIGKTKCLCCKLQNIYQASFSCGHIISEFNGGEIKLDNLKPICTSCNSSMGTRNMDEYIKEFGF